MSAAFLGRGTQSDPALEPSEVGGHTLLQRRLSLYGKALVVQSILYWLIYAIIWGPTVGFKRSLGYIASWDVLLLTAIYSLYWLVARGKPRPTPVLLATDIVGSLAIGIDNVYLMLGDLGTISGVFENLIGFICILLLRSLIVPSTVKRTVLCGLLMCGPTVFGVAFGSHRFDDQSLSWITMMGFSINWSIIALIFSGVASATLYGLRRQVLNGLTGSLALRRAQAQSEPTRARRPRLAKNNAEPRASLTGNNVVLGTPLYISPEAVKGVAVFDARSDIYSLGAVAYCMLTGEPVFTGSSAFEICLQHLTSAPVPPSERLGRALPPDLEAIVLRCLAKSATDRYSNAAELEHALATCAAADQWSADRAQAWWTQRAAAPTVTPESHGAGRTVEIDPATRQALHAAPNMPWRGRGSDPATSGSG